MSVLAEGKRTYMRAGDRRAQILACARGVFAERGFHVTSVADLCEAAGIGRGTLYQYFGNKREVFCAVLEELIERVKDVLDTRPQIGEMKGTELAPPELILAFCATRLRALLDVIFTDEDNLRLILREARGLEAKYTREAEGIESQALALAERGEVVVREAIIEKLLGVQFTLIPYSRDAEPKRLEHIDARSSVDTMVDESHSGGN